MSVCFPNYSNNDVNTVQLEIFHIIWIMYGTKFNIWTIRIGKYPAFDSMCVALDIGINVCAGICMVHVRHEWEEKKGKVGEWGWWNTLLCYPNLNYEFSIHMCCVQANGGQMHQSTSTACIYVIHCTWSISFNHISLTSTRAQFTQHIYLECWISDRHLLPPKSMTISEHGIQSFGFHNTVFFFRDREKASCACACVLECENQIPHIHNSMSNHEQS